MSRRNIDEIDDWRGQRIRRDVRICYPVRQSSSMWVVSGTVGDIYYVNNRLKIQINVDGDSSGFTNKPRTVVIDSVERVTVIGP